MNTGLVVAAALLVGIAAVHSILGERYILTRLFRRDNLPRLFGDDWFTKRTLRFAWHITSIAWLGFAALLVSYALWETPGSVPILEVIAGTFLVSGLVVVLASRGKHLSWLVFLSVALLVWLAR